jgi:hypothetical protein
VAFVRHMKPLLHRLSILGVTGLSALVGFAFYAVFVARAGLNIRSDALFAGTAAAQVFGSAIAAPVAQFMMHLTLAERERQRAALPGVLKLLAIVFALMTPLYWLLARPLMSALFPQLYSEVPDLLVGYYRDAALLPFTTSVVAVLETYMHATRRYRLPRTALLAGRGTSVLLLLAATERSVEYAALLLVLGSAIAASIMMVPAFRDARLGHRATSLGVILRRLVGNFGWASLLRTDNLLENALLAFLPAGTITVYNFGRKLLSAIVDAIRVSFIAQDGRELYDEVRKTAVRGTRVYRLRRHFRLSTYASIAAVACSSCAIVLLALFQHRVTSTAVSAVMTPIGALLLVALVCELFTLQTMAAFQALGEEAAFLRMLGVVFLALAGVRYLATISFGLIGFIVTGALYWTARLAITSLSHIPVCASPASTRTSEGAG